MATSIQETKQFTISPEIMDKFKQVLDKKAPAFLTSVLQVCNSNQQLKAADKTSILNAAMTAATLDLPINGNLGFAYILPYSTKQQDGTFKVMAQFQIGYKGYVQLAQRSGQFKNISACPIYEGDTNETVMSRLTDIMKKNPPSEVIVGYAAYFKLINGFEKSISMTVQELKAHGVKYSKTAAKNTGLWVSDFDAMAQKTVLKLLLSKYAPLSIEMQTAQIADQAIINDPETMDVTYADNGEIKQLTEQDKENERLNSLINKAKTKADLMKLEQHITPEFKDLFNQKFESLK